MKSTLNTTCPLLNSLCPFISVKRILFFLKPAIVKYTKKSFISIARELPAFVSTQDDKPIAAVRTVNKPSLLVDSSNSTMQRRNII
jgi:hypothetical protein